MTAADASLLFRLACRARLGLANWREVERVGLDELAKGNSEPEFVGLASVTAVSNDLAGLVDAALEARGEEPPDHLMAAKMCAREAAEEIVRASLEPYVGARRLWQLARMVPAIEPELRVFIGLASEWEDDPINRAEYDADIASAAQTLLATLSRG